MPLSAQPNVTTAPTIGAQTRLYLAEIDDTDNIPHSGVPTVLTPSTPSGVVVWAGMGGDYTPLGCVRTNKIKYPISPNKPIACGLEPARWMVPARRELGSLDVTCLDFAEEANDAVQFVNKRCVAALVTEDFEGNQVRVEYCIDWAPSFEKDTPEGDGEVTISMSGPFSRLVLDSGGNDTSDKELG